MFSRGKTDDKENIYSSPVESISKIETVRLDSDSSLDTMSVATDPSDFSESSAIHCLRPGKRRLPDLDTLLQPLSPVSRSESTNKRCRSPSTNHTMWPINPSTKCKQAADTLEADEVPSSVFLHSPVFSRSTSMPFSSSADDMSDVMVLPPDSPEESECIRVLDLANGAKRIGTAHRTYLYNEMEKTLTAETTAHDVCEPSVSSLILSASTRRKDSPDIICLSDSDDDSIHARGANRHHMDARHPSRSKPKRKVFESCSTFSTDSSRSSRSKADAGGEVELLPRKSRSKLEMKTKLLLDDRNVCDNAHLSSSIPTNQQLPLLSQDPSFSSAHVLGQLRKSPKCQLYPKISPVNYGKSRNSSKLSKSPDTSKQRSSKSHHTLSIPVWNPISLEKHSRTHLIGDTSPSYKNLHVHKKKRTREKEMSETCDTTAASATSVIPLSLEPTTTMSEPDRELQVQRTQQQQLSDHSNGAERMFMHNLHLGPANSTSEPFVDASNSCCMQQNPSNSPVHGATTIFPHHRSSPDPVQLLEQVQSDEMLAQALQAEFDLEMNRRFTPPLNAPTPSAPPQPPLPPLPFRPIHRRRDREVMLVSAFGGSSWPVSTLWGLNREDRLTVALNLLTLQLAYLDLHTASDWSGIQSDAHADVAFTDLIVPSQRAIAHPTFSSNFLPSSNLVSTSAVPPTAPPSQFRRRQRHHSGRYPPTVRRNQWDIPFNAENEYEMLWELTNRIGHVNSNTMSERQINQLPTRHYKCTTNDTARASTCHICLNEYEQGERLRILPCAHEFHLSCIDRWIKDHPTCPICRSDCRA